MKFNKSLIALLAVFIVVFSACAVSAAEDVNVLADDGDGDGVNDTDDDSEEGYGYDEEMGIYDPNPVPGPMDVENSDLGFPLDPDSPQDNQTQDNQIGSSDSQAKSSSSNTINKTPATGNPILVLLAALAIMGTYSIRRK